MNVHNLHASYAATGPGHRCKHVVCISVIRLENVTSLQEVGLNRFAWHLCTRSCHSRLTRLGYAVLVVLPLYDCQRGVLVVLVVSRLAIDLEIYATLLVPANLDLVQLDEVAMSTLWQFTECLFNRVLIAGSLSEALQRFGDLDPLAS